MEVRPARLVARAVVRRAPQEKCLGGRRVLDGEERKVDAQVRFIVSLASPTGPQLS